MSNDFVVLCPECWQGKHINCTGQAWDDRVDGLVPCECGCREHTAEYDADEDDFNQCPHEAIRATCPGCNCPCAGCDRWRERDRARVLPPDGTDEDSPIIHRPGCSWETTPYCNCGADPERVLPPGKGDADG